MDINVPGDSLPTPVATTTSPPAFPFRKRRRPALACEECRHRKIKCDRSTPCGPCSRSRSKTCTYQNLQDDFPTTAPIVRKIPPHTQPDPMGQNRQQTYDQMTSANNYPSVPSAPGSTSSSLVQSHNGSPATTEHVQALLNRVQTLEKKLLDASRNESNGESSNAPQAQPNPPTSPPKVCKRYKGKKKSNYEKMKFRGQNHWMKYIKQVRFGYT